MDMKDYFCSEKLIYATKFIRIAIPRIKEMDIIEEPHKYEPEIKIFEKFLLDKEATEHFKETGTMPDKYFLELQQVK